MLEIHPDGSSFQTVRYRSEAGSWNPGIYLPYLSKAVTPEEHVAFSLILRRSEAQAFIDICGSAIGGLV